MRTVSAAGKKRNKLRGKTAAALKGKGPAKVLAVERLFRPDGSREKVLVLDSNSPTFARDLTLLFEKNVARARRAYKQKFGSTERASHKI